MPELGMLSVMREVRNFFESTSETGEYTITDSKITLKGGYVPGQYILIFGSVLNDGIYKLSDTVYTLGGAHDETFKGTIYGLRVPSDFVAICNEVAEFNDTNKPSNVVSENFGSYSYTKASEAQSGVVVGVATWQSSFRRKLNPFRRMFTEINI